MKRLPIDYQGFKLGVRSADQLALLLDVTNPQDVKILHQMKNMANVLVGMNNFGAFSVNGVMYAK